MDFKSQNFKNIDINFFQGKGVCMLGQGVKQENSRTTENVFRYYLIRVTILFNPINKKERMQTKINTNNSKGFYQKNRKPFKNRLKL